MKNLKYAISILEASRDPLFTVNSEGKILDVNEAAIKATNRSRIEIIGSDFIDYFTDTSKAKKAYQLIFKVGYISDYLLTIIDGRLMDVICNGYVYKDDDGKVLGAVIVASGISEHKRIELELTKARDAAEVASEIAQIAKIKAEKATEIAENAVKAKQQFLSNMSHEIRTPMNAIIGFTKVLLKTELSAKQKEYLSAIKISGDALIVLIDDILDLAKVDAGKMSFESIPFKMSSTISAIVHLFEIKIQEKNIKLVKEYDLKIPNVLIGDPVRLHQVILNLISNAVKFTSRGTITVRVRLLHEDKENATIEFSVSDTGIGIADNKLVDIFNNFQQASSETSRLYGGTGLGLAIVKQLVETQGGIVKVKSKVGEGATFSFALNFQKSEVVLEEEHPNESFNQDLKNIKVLVAEDIPLNQLLMKTLLDEFGIESDIAANGKIAIEKLLEKEYNLILMDLQMPEMNGFETTEYIRNIIKSNIPIIALTADVTTIDLAKCKAVGMNDYIAKPVDEKVLYNKIINVVKNTSQIIDNQKEVQVGSFLLKCTDLDYLNHRTKSNPVLMMEMIGLYLEQTPPLITAIRNSYDNKDWETLRSAIHKMIPSFSIVGINVDFQNMAKKIQEYASSQLQMESISDMVMAIERVCNQTCTELEEELITIKSTINEK